MKRSEVCPHPDRLPLPTRPGEVLEEEWLKPKAMSQTALAEKMGVHVQVVNGIVQGRRAVTAKTALLLADALDTTPQFWLNLQNACDLWEAQRELGGRSHAPKRRRRGRLPRRSHEEIGKTLDQVVGLVKASKTDLRSEEIRAALKLDKREMPRVRGAGLQKKKLKSKGQKRGGVSSNVKAQP
jgi:addiction module HigA family antidote